MQIKIKDKDGVLLKTGKKYCEEDISVSAETKELRIIPNTEDQINEGLFDKVTVAGDSNLVPENIKKGRNIFGIEGEFDAVDTRDATATAEDIAEGKTAYANGEKIVGAMPVNNNNVTIDITGKTVLAGLMGSIIKIDMIDTSLITDMSGAFQSCSSLKTIPLLDTSKTTRMQSMFRYCSSLESIPLLDTSKVIDMSYMFVACISLQTITLLNTSNVTNMSFMFNACRILQTIPLLDTSKVTNMQSMFDNCPALESIPLLNTSNVTNMQDMFSSCKTLQTIPLLNTGNVRNMQSMFSSCISLVSIPLLNTSNVTTIQSMFNNCAALTTIPKLNTSKITAISGAFRLCPNLSDESLNNILAMCTDAVKITSTTYKTLKSVGLTSDQATRCQSLSNYEAFTAAGWKTGY